MHHLIFFWLDPCTGTSAVFSHLFLLILLWSPHQSLGTLVWGNMAFVSLVFSVLSQFLLFYVLGLLVQEYSFGKLKQLKGEALVVHDFLQVWVSSMAFQNIQSLVTAGYNSQWPFLWLIRWYVQISLLPQMELNILNLCSMSTKQQSSLVAYLNLYVFFILMLLVILLIIEVFSLMFLLQFSWLE